MNSLIHFCLHHKLVVFLLLAFVVGWGVRVAPFDWETGNYPRDPVAVDAIPDLGDNQQIIFTEWPGRSPQDVDDQITYPLTVALLGVPGVKEVRSFSMFGYSYVYLIFEEEVEDLEQAVVAVHDHIPITVGDIATVQLGPAPRWGVLDLNGADAVGGVVVARYGANPLAAIKATKEKIAELAEALPVKAMIDWTETTREEVVKFAAREEIAAPFEPDGTIDQDAWMSYSRSHDLDSWPSWFTTSQVTVVPFYDRSELIGETLNTLDNALYQQVLVTIVVVVIMLLHFRSSLLIAIMLPLAVLITFITMKQWGVEANIVALSGIAIAIGTVVDVGIVLTENILKHLDEADAEESRANVVFRGVTEVAGAVTTSIATTVVSFLPVFTMTGEAGRLFKPLAFTKSFVLVASIVVALTIIPPVAHLLFGIRFRHFRKFAAWRNSPTLKVAFVALNLILALFVTWLLARDWMPLGLDQSTATNFLFIGVIIGGLLASFRLFEQLYPALLKWCLNHKFLFLSAPLLLVLMALSIWLGFGKVFSFVPAMLGDAVTRTSVWQDASEKFPGLGREFRPALDEGSFLFMPTISPHASSLD